MYIQYILYNIDSQCTPMLWLRQYFQYKIIKYHYRVQIVLQKLINEIITNKNKIIFI